MATPIVYADGNDGGDSVTAASIIALQVANSTQTMVVGDTPAIPYAIVTSNTIGVNTYYTNYAVDEDYSALKTSYTLQIANSTQTVSVGDTISIPISILTTTLGTSNTPMEEDHNRLSASFNFLVATTYVRTANDSELPQGNGGPTTTQLWNIG